MPLIPSSILRVFTIGLTGLLAWAIRATEQPLPSLLTNMAYIYAFCGLGWVAFRRESTTYTWYSSLIRITIDFGFVLALFTINNQNFTGWLHSLLILVCLLVLLEAELRAIYLYTAREDEENPFAL